MIAYYLVFGAIAALHWVDRHSRRWIPAFLVVAAVALGCMAGFRGTWVDRDLNGYAALYSDVQSGSYYLANPSEILNKDPAFVGMSLVVQNFFNDDFRALVILFAFIGVTLKVTAIAKLSPYPLLSVLVYYSTNFLLQEMTQIRIGVACGFLLLSILSIVKREPVKYLCWMALAASFHYSALLFLPMYFIDPTRVSVPVYAGVLLLPMFFPFTGYSIHPIFTMLLEGNPLTQRYYVYLTLQARGELAQANLLNVVILFNIAIAVLCLWKWRLLQSASKYAVAILKTQIWSIAVFYMFYDLGAFGFRFMEMFGVVQIILLPSVLSMFKEKRLAAIGVMVTAVGWMSFNLFYVKLLGPYFR